MKKLFLFAIVVLGFTAASYGQSTATASTSVTLIVPISIAKTTDMNFGTIAASNTAGTILLDYNDTPTAGVGGASVILSTAAKTAVFTVTGSLSESISVSVPGSPIALTGTTAGVTVSDFVADCGATTTLDSGSKIIKVKATLNVPANAAADTYTNAAGLAVTVNYN